MTTITLSERLHTIAKRVPVGARFVDVGTDHALLPSYLVQEGIIDFAIATDVAKGPHQAACFAVRRFGFEKQIQVRLGDGLMTVEPGEIDTIAIAGMGGHTAHMILSARPEVVSHATRLIIQPMNAAHHVRKYFRNHGYVIIDDTVLYEDGRFYQLVTANKANESNTSSEYDTYKDDAVWLELVFEYGPSLFQNPTGTFLAYMEHNLRSWGAILDNMRQSDSDSAQARQQEMVEKITRVEQWLASAKQVEGR